MRIMKRIHKKYFFHLVAVIISLSVLFIVPAVLYSGNLKPVQKDHNTAKPALNLQETPKTGYSKITIWEGYKAFKSGKSVFIDARHTEDYIEGHVPGAINIIPERFTDTMDKSLKTKNIIVYCHSRDCDWSEKLAKELVKQGFKNIRIMTEGWEGWNMSGYPAETGG